MTSNYLDRISEKSNEISWWENPNYDKNISQKVGVDSVGLEKIISIDERIPWVNIDHIKDGIGTDINTEALYATNEQFYRTNQKFLKHKKNSHYYDLLNSLEQKYKEQNVPPGRHIIYEQFNEIAKKIDNEDMLCVFKGGLSLSKVIDQILVDMDSYIDSDFFKNINPPIFKYGDFDSTIFIRDGDEFGIKSDNIKKIIYPILEKYEEKFNKGIKMMKQYNKFKDINKIDIWAPTYYHIAVVRFLCRISIIINSINSDEIKQNDYKKKIQIYIKNKETDYENEGRKIKDISVEDIILPASGRSSRKLNKGSMTRSPKKRNQNSKTYMKLEENNKVDSSPYFISVNEVIRVDDDYKFKLIRTKFNYGTTVSLPLPLPLPSQNNINKLSLSIHDESDDKRNISFPGEIIDITIPYYKNQKYFEQKDTYLLNFNIKTEKIDNSKDKDSIYTMSLEAHIKDLIVTFKAYECIWMDKKYKKRLNRLITILGIKFMLEFDNFKSKDFRSYINKQLQGVVNWLNDEKNTEKCINKYYSNQNGVLPMNDLLEEINNPDIIKDIEILSYSNLKKKIIKNIGRKNEIGEAINKISNKTNINKKRMHYLYLNSTENSSDKKNVYAKYSAAMFQIKKKEFLEYIDISINNIYTKLIKKSEQMPSSERNPIFKQYFGSSITGGYRRTKKITKKTKKTRKHNGIHQSGGNKGRLKKGYKYSGKKLKSGLPQIIKSKKIKSKKN